MSKKNKKSKRNQPKAKKTTNTTKEVIKENKEEIIEDVAGLDEEKEEKTVETKKEEKNKKEEIVKEDTKETDKTEKAEEKNDDKEKQEEEKKKDKKAEKIIAEIEKEKKHQKKMSKEYEKKANKNIFKNIIIAIIILAFCILKILGYMNIREDTFVVDLKVFSISILIFSIILFERSYKKIDLTLFAHGLEALFVAIVTLCEVYIYQLFIDKFVMVISIEALMISVYYIVKCVRIYGKTKKEYLRSLNDISEIVKEEKIIKIETHRKRTKKNRRKK